MFGGAFEMPDPTTDEWLKDEKNPIPFPDNFIAAAYLSLAMTAGVIGNGWLVVAYFRNKLKSQYNSLILNLALAQSLMLMTFPVKIAALFVGEFQNEFPFGWLSCQLIGCLSFVSGIASIMTLFAMSVERYYVTRNPRNAQQNQVFSWLLSIWIFSIGWGIMPLAGWSEYRPEANQMSCTIDWHGKDPRTISYLVCSLALVWFLPTSVMTVFFGRILWLRRVKVGPSVDMATIEQASEQDVHVQWHQTWASLAMLISFLVCWTPYAIISVLGNTLGAVSVSPAGSLVAPIMAKTFVILNPAIYFLFEHIDMFNEAPRAARAETLTPISVLASLDMYRRSSSLPGTVHRASELSRLSVTVSLSASASSSHLINSVRRFQEQQLTTTNCQE
ncbi:melanopsin-A-like [Lineus longissimus]|uniref:melanopsin-A-like n=1 Tax=Lineus longissimus TaxID=88925 RepID=UPI002B4D8FD2